MWIDKICLLLIIYIQDHRSTNLTNVFFHTFAWFIGGKNKGKIGTQNYLIAWYMLKFSSVAILHMGT